MARNGFFYDRRREGVPLIPAGIAGLVGISRGLIASWDTDEWAKSAQNPAVAKGVVCPSAEPPLDLRHDHTLWLDGALGVLGGVGLVADWHEDISETLLTIAIFDLASTVAFKMGQGQQAVPQNPQAARGARLQGPARTSALLEREAAGLL